MHFKYVRLLLLLCLAFMASLALAHFPNNTPSVEMHSLDTEPTTHEQYCNDTIRNTVSNHQNSDPNLLTAPTPGTDANQGERFSGDSQTFETNTEDTCWSSTSVMYGLLMLANKSDYVNEKCHAELRMIYNGIRQREVWAIKGC